MAGAPEPDDVSAEMININDISPILLSLEL